MNVPNNDQALVKCPMCPFEGVRKASTALEGKCPRCSAAVELVNGTPIPEPPPANDPMKYYRGVKIRIPGKVSFLPPTIRKLTEHRAPSVALAVEAIVEAWAKGE